MKSLSILIIEDNFGDFVLLEQMLGKLRDLRKDIFHVETLLSGLELLSERNIDIVLLDLTLPDSYGIESFHKINNAHPTVPVLILSGLNDKKFALEAVKSGAQEYLVKGEFEENLLEKCISYSIERKQSIELIRQSEETYKHLFDFNPIPIFIWDTKSGQIIKVNNAAIHHYGYTEKEFLGKSVFQIIDNTDLKRFENQQFSANDPSEFIGIMRHLKKDDVEILVESRIRNIFIDQMPCKMIIANDITERRKVQGEINFQANVLKNVRDIIFVTDLQGKINYWNEGAEEAFGYDANEILGNSFEILFPEVEKHKAVIDHQEIINKTINQWEVKLITKDSSIIWVDLKATLLLDDQDQVIGVIRVGKDITQTKIDSEKQRETVATLNSIFDNVVQAIVLLDPYKRVRAFNKTANKNAIALMGKELEIGQRFYDYLLPDMYSEFKEKFDHAQFNHVIQHQLCYKFEGRKNIWFNTNFNPISTDDGQVIGVCLSMLNITEQIETDEKLRMQYREIEKTNEELDRFVYSASHDLRAPLTSILGLINLAKLESKEEPALLYMDMMEKSVKKLDGFINDIISYSRNTRLEVQKSRINFKEIIDEIKENLQFMEGGERIEWRIQIDEQQPFFSDLSRIKIILSNLLSNAIRYHNFSQEHLWIEVNVLSDKDNAIIKVSDNGTGIEKDKLDKIFDMFYRASEKSGGSGIGLYIVKEIVTKLGGEIQVDSILGKGSTFTLVFKHDN